MKILAMEASGAAVFLTVVKWNIDDRKLVQKNSDLSN
jgi:hypothetical protein